MEESRLRPLQSQDSQALRKIGLSISGVDDDLLTTVSDGGILRDASSSLK